MTIFNGSYQGRNLKIGIVAARFNEFITEKLVSGAIDTLQQNGVELDDIDVAWVPGAFEIPLIVQNLAGTNKYDGLIALGSVIRGETSHYDYVCTGVASGVAKVSLEENTPIMFGVLTTDNVEQAMNRAGLKSGNKGRDCALSVLEMINLRKELIKAN